VERMRKPWLSYNWFFSLTPLGREQKALLKTTHRFIDSVYLFSITFGIQTLISPSLQVISQRRGYLNRMKQKGETLQYTEGMRLDLFTFLPYSNIYDFI